MPLFWNFWSASFSTRGDAPGCRGYREPMFVTVLWSKRHLRNFLSKISMICSLLEVINVLEVRSYLFNPKSGSKSQSDLQATNPIYSRYQIPLWCHCFATFLHPLTVCEFMSAHSSDGVFFATISGLIIFHLCLARIIWLGRNSSTGWRSLCSNGEHRAVVAYRALPLGCYTGSMYCNSLEIGSYNSTFSFKVFSQVCDPQRLKFVMWLLIKSRRERLDRI